MMRDDIVSTETHYQGKRWLQMLNEFDVRFLALDVEMDRALVEFFQTQPEWTIDCRDEESVLFVRAGNAQTSRRQVRMQGGLVPA